MKNIHILATDKPSRLYLSDYGKELNLSAYPLRNYTTGQHIYITNSEEIKIGDYYYLPRTNSVYKCIEDPTELNLERRLGIAKIILTTDGDLIKDGVQAIDDEFLEWLVNNPSCEYVTIRKKSVVKAIVKRIGIKNFDNGYKIIIPKSELANKLKQILDNMSQEEFDEEWKKITDLKMEGPSIIIPKEEQKQHLIDMMKSDEELGLYDEPKTKCYCGHTTYCDCGPEQHVDFINSNIDEFDKALKLSKQENCCTPEGQIKRYKDCKGCSKEPKQETLEEAINNFKKTDVYINEIKQKQERMYSEEEVIDLLQEMNDYPTIFEGRIDIKEWFEQLKKK
jgi:hypothetical protein